MAVDQLAVEFQRRGDSVSRLTRGTSLCVQRSRDQRGPYYRAKMGTPITRPIGLLASLFRLPISYCAISWFLWRRGVDAVIIQYVTPGQFPLALACRTLSIPLMAVFQGSDAHSLHTRTGIAAGYLRGMLRRADAVAAVSTGLLRKVQAFYPALHQKGRAIPNGAPHLTTVSRRRDAATPPTLLAVGKLIPRKGFDILLRAVAGLSAGSETVRLDIIGEGPDREALQCLHTQLGLGSNVRLVGARSHREVLQAMLEAEIFVLCSRAEGLALVMVEAMAAGCAIITTDVEGARDVIESGINGLVVPIEDAPSLTAAIESLISDSDRRSALQAAAMKTARGLSWQDICERYAQLLTASSSPRQARLNP